MKVLAIKLRRLGDTILWTAALDALSHWDSVSCLDILYPEPYQDLFQTDSRVRKQWHWDSSQRLDWKLAQTLRAEKYDAVLTFHASSKSLALTCLAMPKVKILHHHSRKPKNFFSDKPVPELGKRLSAVERDLNTVRALGWKGLSPAPSLQLHPDFKNDAQELLKTAGISLSKPFIVLGVQASRPSKMWPLENYVELSRGLNDFQLITLCEKNDGLRGALGKELSERVKTLPTPKLGTALGVLSHAKAYVGSDSGLKHAACALNVPTLTLFGPESVGEWHGYDPSRHLFLKKEVACRFQDQDVPNFAWCAEFICPLSSHACMKLIRPEEVLNELHKMLL